MEKSIFVHMRHLVNLMILLQKLEGTLKIMKNPINLLLKTWRKSGILSVRKSENPVWSTVNSLMVIVFSLVIICSIL